MIKTARMFSVVLLLILAIAALPGGLLFIIDPSGKTIQIPLELLQGTPFTDFLIPGIILFLSNGILSLVITVLTIKKVKNYPWFIILQGCVLIGWLTVELIINIEFFAPVLHYPLYTMGVLMISFGFLIIRENKTKAVQ